MRARKVEGASCLRLLRRIEDVGAKFVASYPTIYRSLDRLAHLGRHAPITVQPRPHVLRLLADTTSQGGLPACEFNCFA